MVEQIYSLVYSIFMVFLAEQFGKLFSIRRILLTRTVLFIGAEWSVLLFTMSFFVDSAPIRVSLSILLTILHYQILFNNSILKTIPLGMGFISLALAMECVMYILLSLLVPDIDMNSIFENTISYYMSIGSQMLQLLTIIIISVKFKKKNTVSIPSKQWVKYIIVPLFTLGFVYFIVASLESEDTFRVSEALISLAIGLIALNIFVYIFLKNEVDRQIELERANTLYKHAEELHIVYQQLNNERRKLAAENHEFRNLVSSWKTLLENKEYNKLNKMFYDICSEMSSHINVISTGNTTIDSVLNTKYYEAIDKGISFEFILDDLSEITIDDADLIILMSNIYNNAIEACEKVLCDNNSGRVEISTKCITKLNKLFFTVRNSYDGQINYDMSTTKKDKTLHGYGINAIKSVIAKYNGNYYTEMDGNVFTTYVIIPLECNLA